MDKNHGEDVEKSPLLSSTDTDLQNQNYTSINSNLQGEVIGNVLGGDSVNSSLINSQIIIVHKHKIKVYKRRWYVLLMFSLFCVSQNLIWNSWGPISDSAKDAFNWTDFDISLLTNWGPISYMIGGTFFSWMLDVKGLRMSCLISIFLVAVGGGLRCITSTPPLSNWLIHFGQFLNGLGGPVGMAGSPVVSATWFPPNERTTATSIAVLVPSIIGLAGSFLIGPLLVPSHSNHIQNASFINDSHYYLQEKMMFYDTYHLNNNHTNSSIRIEEERKDIMFLMYIEFAAACSVFLVMLIYFPKKPPLPPSASASITRQDFWSGLKALFRCKQFWLIAVAYGSSVGVLNCWIGVIDVNLSPLGVSQTEAGMIGFWATVAGCLLSLIVAIFADKFSKHLKICILVLYGVGTVFILWFALACKQIVPSSLSVFYVTIIIGAMTINATTPLLYEMACELAYPIGEGTTNGMMTIMNNLGGLIFLFILMIPNIGTMWMNWALLGATVICFPLYGMLKETYNRLDLDNSAPAKSETTYINPDPIQ